MSNAGIWGRPARRTGLVGGLVLVGAGAVFMAGGQSAGDLEKRFRELDQDRDERLTPQELTDKAWFTRLDQDKDGIVTIAELRQFNRSVATTARGGNGPAGEGLFKLLDKNGDGKLTREELPRPDSFDRLDVNGDGAVTFDEARSALANVGAMRGRAAEPAPNSAPNPPPAAEPSPRVGPTPLKPAEAGVGRWVPDLTFTDVEGKGGRLSDYRGQRALVIAFTSTSCPVSKRYLPTLARLEQEFGPRGAAFLYVNPTETDTADSIRAERTAHGLRGRYVHDRDDALARALAARSTTEVIVLDAARTVTYRGAVDDQYGLAYSKDEPRERYLVQALEATLRGETPALAATTAPGCALESADAPQPAAVPVTYHGQISRLLQHHCVECHRRGGVAPFSLETYEDVKAHAGMMRQQVERGVMPPWFAAPEKAGHPSPWINDRSLSAPDKAGLLAWLAGDKPAGNPADAPLPRKFPAEWQIGRPDLVVQIPQPITVKATGTMPYQNITVDPGLTADKWVRAVEVQPTAREVVHHVIVFVRPPRTAGGKDAFDDERAERQGFFAAYVPGNSASIFPAGMAKKLPAGSRLHFQIHYTPGGKVTQDQVRVGLVFGQEEPEHIVQVAGIANPFINIPPGAANHPETAQLRTPTDVYLLEFMPHMHLRGKAVRYEAVYPDGKTRTLLDIPRYDFNWQLGYRLAEPLFLPAGTVIKVNAAFDNSPGNPANPDPTRTVRWGQQTFDEMLIGYVAYYTPNDQAISRGRLRAGR